MLLVFELFETKGWEHLLLRSVELGDIYRVSTSERRFGDLGAKDEGHCSPPRESPHWS